MNRGKSMAEIRWCVFLAVLSIVCIGAMYVPAAVARDDAPTEKILLVYYSRTGNTKLACETISKELGCDIIEIRDLANREGRWGYYSAAFGSIFGTHTAIEPAEFDLAPYGAVIIGSPVWAGKPSAAIRTFIGNNRFDGKKFFFVYTTNVLLKQTSLDRVEKMAAQSDGRASGIFQVAVTESRDGEKVEVPLQRIVDDALKIAAEILNSLQEQ